MIGVAVLVYIARPLGYHILCQVGIAHGVHIVHRGVHILYLAEAYLAISLLRPGKRTGYI